MFAQNTSHISHKRMVFLQCACACGWSASLPRQTCARSSRIWKAVRGYAWRRVLVICSHPKKRVCSDRSQMACLTSGSTRELSQLTADWMTDYIDRISNNMMSLAGHHLVCRFCRTLSLVRRREYSFHSRSCHACVRWQAWCLQEDWYWVIFHPPKV